jgi:hypothetical protein
MTDADDAARLAKQIEKDNPAMAGMIYALLAVAGQRAAEPEPEWTEVFSDDDILVDWDTIYLIEDKDGSAARVAVHCGWCPQRCCLLGRR